jgi:3-oxoacyl-[acyl-carrier protein] reductase
MNVNLVAPDNAETEMLRVLASKTVNDIFSKIVLGRIGQPEDIANLVAFLCFDKARHITGEIIKVDGGQYI